MLYFWKISERLKNEVLILTNGIIQKEKLKSENWIQWTLIVCLWAFFYQAFCSPSIQWNYLSRSLVTPVLAKYVVNLEFSLWWFCSKFIQLTSPFFLKPYSEWLLQKHTHLVVFFLLHLLFFIYFILLLIQSKMEDLASLFSVFLFIYALL